MDKFWEEQFAEVPEAEGIDFVSIGTMPWDLNKHIFQSNLKKDFENPHLATPRSGRLFWKMEDGKKKYLLTPKEEAIFEKEFCCMCGSQRCPGDTEAILNCGSFKRIEDKKKRADVSVTYTFSFDPSTVGLLNDCTEREFAAAVDGYMNRVFEEVEKAANIVPDTIDTEFLGF